MDITKIISSACPFPHFISEANIIADGFQIAIPDECKKNCHFKCVEQIESFALEIFLECPYAKKFSLFKKKINGFVILIFGIILHDSKKISRKQKKKLIYYTVKQESIINWINNLNAFIKKQISYIEELVKESLNPLHDVKTAISLIFRNTEALIMQENGDTIDEKIENSDPYKKALFKSVALLEERIKLMDLISNPSAASHGQRRRTPVYKIIDKLVKVHYVLANKKNIRLKLTGTSYNAPFLYESFSTVPLVLLDNAIKYSIENQDVVIKVIDLPQNAVRVSIESYSPYINQDLKKKIFEKGIRGSYAHYVARQGSGMGLFLARIVANANNFTIEHSDNGQKNLLNGIEYTVNTFSFEIKDKII